MERTHGMSKSPEYMVWGAMIQRCTNPKNRFFSRYGGRGVGVCERWRDFASFLSDVGPRPFADATLDRIDNDGNYEPGNVRWVSNAENCRHSSQAVRITINGETRAINEWCEHLGINRSTYLYRRSIGMSYEEALTKPRRAYTRKG